MRGLIFKDLFHYFLPKEGNTDGKQIFHFWSTAVVPVGRRLGTGHKEEVDREIREFLICDCASAAHPVK